MPTAAEIPGYTIFDLLPVVNAVQQLPGGLFEVEVLAGPVAGAYVNRRLTFEQLLDVLSSYATVTLGQAKASGYHPVAGRLYGIFAANNVSQAEPSWNADGVAGRTVLVQGLPGGTWASEGLLVLAGGGSQRVDVDVAAGTYEAQNVGGQGGESLAGSYTATQAGQQVIAVSGAVGFGTVSVNGVVLTFGTDYTTQAGQLTILAAADVQVGEVVQYHYQTGSAGAGYTDAAARAAQLNRVPAQATSTVTLTAESPTDYGTATSGSFTVDATNCVVGKVVRFAVAASGSAPAFTAAPAGQPYKQLGVSYASGHAYSYSLLVGVDVIEVVCLLND